MSCMSTQAELVNLTTLSDLFQASEFAQFASNPSIAEQTKMGLNVKLESEGTWASQLHKEADTPLNTLIEI